MFLFITIPSLFNHCIYYRFVFTVSISLFLTPTIIHAHPVPDDSSSDEDDGPEPCSQEVPSSLDEEDRSSDRIEEHEEDRSSDMVEEQSPQTPGNSLP